MVIEKMSPKYVSLCFDDGYLEHYKIAKALYKLDAPATFFMITGLSEYRGKKLLIKDVKLVKEIDDLGHEIASHTHLHRNLTLLSDKEIEEECRKSIEVLDSILRDRTDVYGFAYPYGAYNKRVISIVSRYFKYGRTMGKTNRWNTIVDRFKIGSMGLRHLIKYPFKKFKHNPRLIVITFHDENALVVKSLVQLLKVADFKIVTLAEALSSLSDAAFSLHIEY